MLSETQINELKVIKIQLESYDVKVIRQAILTDNLETFLNSYNKAKLVVEQVLLTKISIPFEGYQAIVAVLNEYIEFLKDLKKTINGAITQISLVFQVNLKQLNDKIESAYKLLLTIKDVSEGKLTTKSKRDRILSLFDMFIDEVGIYNRKESIDKVLQESQQLYKSLESQVEELRATNKDLIESSQLVTQSAMFNEAANKNKQESYFWLVMIVLSIATFIILICHLMNNFCFDMDCYMPQDLVKYNDVCATCGQNVLWLAIAKSLFFRILLISFNLYVISFCIKNYNAAMHNKTINRHRNNSFAVAFHLFNNTTSKNKDEILSKAADSIFQYQKTGYYSKDSQPTNPNVVQNIFDKFTGKD